ncbi:MAG: DNA polymerase III subunit delta [Acidobacteria bacterium]|nr:DNA polymerase III subunit delta [Acidobacteriota bacterium]|tara:strand:- start:25030 stop:25995 length:966 start_codon:yes stop_codon:yes gene_type:complete
MSSSLTPDAALKQISTGDLAPVYLILGDDDQEKSEMAEAFEQAIDEGLRAFNVDRLDGSEVTIWRILESAQASPMMVPRRVVVVYRLERCLMPAREGKVADVEREAFGAYLDAPYSHVTLVLVAGNLDKRTNLVKHLYKAATVVNCEVIKDLKDAERWIERRVSAEGLSIDGEAARLMAAVGGPNLARLRGDVERLLIYAANQQNIGVDEVRSTMGSAVAHDHWALTNAILRNQVEKALKALSLMLADGAIPVVVLGQLRWMVGAKKSRFQSAVFPPGRIPSAVEAIFRTDLALKRSAGDPEVLLERLVMDLCGVNVEQTS